MGFDLSALDVALGLIFVYLILALVCSALNEAIASAMSWRAKFLREGLANLMAGRGEVGALSGRELVDALYAHPLIGGLIRHRKPLLRKIIRGPRYPSYIPSRTFVTAVLDQTPAQTLKHIEQTPLGFAIDSLKTRYGTQAAAYEAALETWYDDAMERVSGWYRRRVQISLWILSALLVIALNADTIQIARNLWSDKAVRAAVVARAGAVVQQSGGEVPKTPDVKDVATKVDDLKELKIPLGWTKQTHPKGLWNWRWLEKFLGLLLTAGALTLGAPFWFDALSKVARIRSSGAPPPATDAVRTTDAEQPRAGDVTVHLVPGAATAAAASPETTGVSEESPAEEPAPPE